MRLDSVASGARLRRIRKACGASLRSVAVRAGVSPGHLADIENGRRGVSEELWDKLLGAIYDGG